MISTFSSFTTAQLALRASQTALNVTGQNIANVSTSGYTRQALDQISINYNNAGRYASGTTVGQGVLVTGISQIRDPFLDIRFRTEIAEVGEADSKLTTLKELETILDEISKDGIYAQLSDLESMLQKLSNVSNVSAQEFESMVKSSSDSLTKLFNQYANQLQGVRDDAESNITEVDVPAINDIIKNIGELNKTIKSAQIQGSSALELMDQRNTLIDELSSYMKVEASYTSEKISGSTSIDKLTVNLVLDDGTKFSLVEGDVYGEISVNKVNDKFTFTAKSDIADADFTAFTTENPLASGTLKSSLYMVNESGEFDGVSTTEKGIGYYEKMLDLMASTFAKTFNDLNNDGAVGGTGNDLFAANDGSGVITAKNISIASGWNDGSYGSNTSTDPDAASGANDNVLRMISALSDSSTHEFSTTTATGTNYKAFEGSFHGFFAETVTILGLDIKATTSTLNNHVAIASEIQDSRDGVSGVSLDEEAMSLMKYQSSYSAAARLMTTLDEALDTLINKMGVVGR
ncbi:MAG: flagellar hook-associated protein FlgK, partial [Anaerotignaceae bacterium]